jgi:hypothetical protein
VVNHICYKAIWLILCIQKFYYKTNCWNNLNNCKKNYYMLCILSLIVLKFCSLVDESLLYRVVVSLNWIELVFKLQLKACKCTIYYSTANLTWHIVNVQFVVSYFKVIRAWLLHVVEAEPSVANVAWSFNVVCVDGQSERFHCACGGNLTPVNVWQIGIGN